jgi:NADP-dependent 3-hydroxy acid dehydrogenase YdfG
MPKLVAVVTGASQGIGRATAVRLAKDFSALALAARDGEALKEVAVEVKSNGAEPLAFAIDLSLRESAETLIQGTFDRFGRIDALLNIAGAVPQIDLFQMTDGEWQGGLELKLHGARRLTILAWEALKASKGSVVLISG